jgi:HTH-type transcriptional regulator, transcriptional repressor of NAD biosynthesis genes
MTKRFRRGLVVGKFAPLHRGHELLIRRALDECDDVVILSYCKPEMPECPPERRERWLEMLFPDARRLVLDEDRLRKHSATNDCPTSIPGNDAPGEEHREFCAFLCQQVLGVTVDAAFTSEDYGDEFAAGLTRCFRRTDPSAVSVEHVLVDRHREAIPISGSVLRANTHVHRQWLTPSVYATFVKRVCVLGGESSGKTTLCLALAREFDTLHVAEFGRELWEERGGDLSPRDLVRIAETHIAREEHCAQHANEFLFCDTSPLTTLFYARHYFGAAPPELEQHAIRPYDCTILCAPDFPFVQDGTRQDSSFRAMQHDWYVRELTERGTSFLVASGSTTDRVAQVRRVLMATFVGSKA